MDNKLKSMGGLVTMASVLMLSPVQPVQAMGHHHILGGVVAGLAAEKIAQAHHRHQEKRKADDAAGIPRKPSVMGKEFDDTLKERLAKAKADREAAGDGQQPSLVSEFKQRLAASRARAAHQVADQGQQSAPSPSKGPGF